MAREAAISKQRRREQLRDFLRVRRGRLTPDDVGLPTAGRRRTPGLRREEVALLAGVGVSWYTWLEQGRDINVSTDVLDAIGRALHLNEPERAHLYALAGLNPPYTDNAAAPPVTAELRNVLDAWAPRPGLLRDRYWNLHAINDGARMVFGYDDADNNCLISFFTNSRYRGMHVQWASIAPQVVAAFRAAAAPYPDDPEFRRVVDELSATSPEFSQLWARHDVAAPGQAVKAIRHPDVGDLVFDMTTLAVADSPDWHVELYNPQPGSDTGRRLEQLERVRHGHAA